MMPCETLLDRRDMTSLTPAEKIIASPTSPSHILNRLSCPQQGTRSKLITTLCPIPDEQQLVVSGFSGLPDTIDHESAAISPNVHISAVEPDRVAYFLDLKTLSIDFHEPGTRTLTNSGIVFESYARSGIGVADFLLTTPARTAIDCKFNVNRDWERETCTAHILRTHLPCEHAIVVVPYLKNLAAQFSATLAQVGARVVSITDLPDALSEKGAT